MSFEHPILVLLHIAAFALFISLFVSGLMIYAGPLDRPNSRSSHANIIPTSAGLGLVAGLGAGFLALVFFYPNFYNTDLPLNLLAKILALTFAVAVLGLIDDVYNMSAKYKFVISVLFCIALVVIIGAPNYFPLLNDKLEIPFIIGLLGASLWVFVLTNGVNFMDGANGLMGVPMLIAFIALAIIAYNERAITTVILSIVMAAGLLGFLPYNFRKNAKVFSGDIGSLICGFVFASACLLLLREAPDSGLLYIGPLLILPFLTDILLTMLKRALKGENLLAPHRKHLYQKILVSGRSHVFVTMLYAGAFMIMAVFTIIAHNNNITGSVFVLAFWVFIFTLIYYLANRKFSN